MFLSWSIVQSALELGLVYGLVALAGHPILAIPAAMAAGVCSGFVTALLQTKLGVESLLAGIIVNTALYTVNISVMGRSTLSLNDTPSVFTAAKALLADTPLAGYYKLVVVLLFAVLVCVLEIFFLGTRLGLSIRATGNNPEMVKSSSINPSKIIIIGLCISNAITALGGCLIGEYQKSCDINMGSGMVTIALASLIIGETIFGRKSIGWRAVGVVVGACLYRVVVAIALRFNLPASALKLVSALIVAVAISYPTLVKLVEFENRKLAAKGKSLHRILMGCGGAAAVGFGALAAVLPGSRAVFVLLALVGAVVAVLAFRAEKKNQEGKAVC